MTRWPPLPDYIAPVRGAYTEVTDMTDKTEIEALVDLANAWGEVNLAQGRESQSRDMAKIATALTTLQAQLVAAEARAEKAERALKPFASHVDKATCKITMIWQDGDYKSTYTETLKPQDFFTAAEVRRAALPADANKEK